MRFKYAIFRAYMEYGKGIGTKRQTSVFFLRCEPALACFRCDMKRTLVKIKLFIQMKNASLKKNTFYARIYASAFQNAAQNLI